MKLHPNVYITLTLTYFNGPVLNAIDDQTQPCKDTATTLNILKHERKQWFMFCNSLCKAITYMDRIWVEMPYKKENSLLGENPNVSDSVGLKSTIGMYFGKAIFYCYIWGRETLKHEKLEEWRNTFAHCILGKKTGLQIKNTSNTCMQQCSI